MRAIVSFVTLVDDSWTKNKDSRIVKVYREYERSMSVGDIIKWYDDSGNLMRVERCASIGFEIVKEF